MQAINKPGPENQYLSKHVELLISSYLHWTGKELIKAQPNDNTIYQALYRAPYGIVSHNTEQDPIFNYGNLTALKVFEMDWFTFTQFPSRKSAERVNQAEREQLMNRVSKNGFIDDYHGIRISSTGKRFIIENATVWNVIDKKGVYYGQAAVFYRCSQL